MIRSMKPRFFIGAFLALFISRAWSAEHFTDFSGVTNGDIGSDADWTQSEGGGWEQDVGADGGATGGKTLVVEDPTGFWGDELQEFYNTALAATSGDVEVVAKIKAELTSLGTAAPIGVSLTDQGGFYYSLSYGGSGSWSLYYFQGASQWSGIQTGVTSLTLVTDTYFWVRLGRSGTTIRARIWADGDAEPGWQLSGTNTTLTTVSPGLVFQDSSASPYTVDVFGMATAGDSAPTSGGGSQSPVPIILQQH